MHLLFVGLGNPGPQYEHNRHNIGFMLLDRIHARWNAAPWRRKFQGEIAEAAIGGVRTLLLKPTTYMNESGRAVAEAARFYKLPAEKILVAHDELDLAPGKFRVKTGGGTGGHNGLRSMAAQVGDTTRRLRLGIGHPGHKDAVPRYVLQDFAKADADWLDPLLDAMAEHAGLLTAGRDNQFANKVHAALGHDGSAKPAARAPSAKAAREPGAPGAATAGSAPQSPSGPAPKPSPDAASTRSKGGPFAALAGLVKRT